MDFISAVRSSVYHSFFGDHNPVSTINGFHEIIKSIPDGSSILDVGCGDGIYYTGKDVIALIRSKNLTIKSVDIDAGAVPICQKRIKTAGLSECVTAECIDLLKIHQRYDVVLFMESFPVIPRDLMAVFIEHTKTITDEILLYHNLVEDKNWFLDWLKPRIKYVTLVDFGQLTSVEEQEIECKKWGFAHYDIEPCLSCTAADMYWALQLPGVGDTVVTQYMVQLHASKK